MPDDSGGIISRDDLDRLVDLFGRYEGALDPLSDDCLDAEYQFNALVEKLHTDNVLPAKQSISLSDFRSYTRRKCRLIVSAKGPRYPCISPNIAFVDPIDPFEGEENP
jgi:hypothetical protein